MIEIDTYFEPDSHSMLFRSFRFTRDLDDNEILASLNVNQDLGDTTLDAGMLGVPDG